MSPTFFRPPCDMDDARRRLTTPAIHNGNAAIIQDAWLFMAEARGLRVNLDRLHPAHLVERAAPAVNDIDAARVAAIPLIHRAMRGLGLEPRGAA